MRLAIVSAVLIPVVSATNKVYSQCGVHSDRSWESWQETYETDIPLVYPRTDNELNDIVNKARTGGCVVRPAGTGHSASGIVVQQTEYKSIVVSLADYTPPSAWNRVIDDANLRVRMSAGATQLDLIQLLRVNGYQLATYTGSAFFSLGGVYLSTSVHGQTFGQDRATSLLTGVLAMNGNGEVIEVGGDDIMDWRGSMGLLGVVLAVEVRIERDYGRTMEAERRKVKTWERDHVTSMISQAAAGKNSMAIWYSYYANEMVFYTTYDSGNPATLEERKMADEYYKDILRKVPDLAKTGGAKSSLLALGVNIIGTTLPQILSGVVFESSIKKLAMTPGDGYVADASTTAYPFNEVQAFIPCASDCIEDGAIFEVLDATRQYYGTGAKRDRNFPGFATQIRLVDVNSEPMMTLENLQKGKRYISITDSNPRSTTTIQPATEEFALLQDVWDRFSGRQAGFHVGKQYGFGKLGDLPGLVPYQDDYIAERFFDDEVTAKFLSAMDRYDPQGVFAGGEGLRLLGISDVKYEIRRPSIETRIGASAKCLLVNDAECQSGCCCDSLWPWDCQARAFSCTEIKNLPSGSKCSVDCNCASGTCSWGKCR